LTTPHPRVILGKNSENSTGISPFWSGIRRRASQKNRRLLFPESTDSRVLSAVSFLAGNKLARPVLVGNAAAIQEAARNGFSLEDVEILDPALSPRKKEYGEALYEKRKAKGLSQEQARSLLEDPLYFSCMALRDGAADGVVAGAVRTTADTVRAGFACLGLAPGVGVAFGVFFMECPNAPAGSRLVLFADSAVSPHPSPRALAAVGLECAKIFEHFVGETPRVAYLSFSTRGSAEDESVAELRQAVAHVRQKSPALAVDGELQGDAALVLDIARQKGAEDSPVAGSANVLIFPDLNAGNIAYKLVQHLGGARAVGPLLAGLSKPMTDLSRGCSDEDIVDAAALVSLMENGKERGA
jgi:phosphate acetyltransferase